MTEQRYPLQKVVGTAPLNVIFKIWTRSYLIRNKKPVNMLHVSRFSKEGGITELWSKQCIPLEYVSHLFLIQKVKQSLLAQGVSY